MKQGIIAFTCGLLVCWSAQAREPITRVAEIRALAPEEAATGIPVRVRGVVTFCHERARTLFLHDGGKGIYVHQNELASPVWPKPGDQIEVIGQTADGLFAPMIRCTPPADPAITILAHGSLPPPLPVDGRELAKPEVDCEWVTVEADVTDVLMHGGALVLQCRAGPCDFHVLMEGPVPAEQRGPWNLAEQRVRIQGVAATIFNSNRQMTKRFLRINSPTDIVPVGPAPPPREATLAGSSQFLRLDGPGPDQKVRIRGVVTLDLPGRGLFLRNDGGGLWVQTAEGPRTRTGDVVEVEGWPRAGSMKPFVLAAKVVPAGQQAPPDPVRRSASEILAARYESDLVACDAELINTYHGVDGTTLEFRDGPVVFRGWLDRESGTPSDFRPGSLLRVSGIAQVTTSGEFTPLRSEDKLVVRLRSPADLMLLRSPPWWTLSRLAWTFAATLALLAVVLQRNRMLRKRRQAYEKSAFEAVLAERGRFAREIHDSLAQGLTSVSMQLECVRDQLHHAPTQAAEHLETARQLVRESMREARRTIWNLRPMALGEADLASALQKYARDLTRDTGIFCEQQIEGTPRPLKPDQETALLRIGQESLTNAVRHAAPRRLVVRLRFEERWVTLVVKDDGRGFDVASEVGKGYGLTGMRERVEALGGSLTIDSHPTEGTEVSVTLSS